MNHDQGAYTKRPDFPLREVRSFLFLEGKVKKEYIKDDPHDGLPPPKSQYHGMLLDIGNALASSFGGYIDEMPNGMVAGVSPADQKFLNALRRIKQAIATASGGGGSENKQDKIPPASDYHHYIVQQPGNTSNPGDIAFTKNGDILMFPVVLKDALQQYGFISNSVYDDIFTQYSAEDFIDTLTFQLINYDIVNGNYLNLPKIFESGILTGTVYLLSNLVTKIMRGGVGDDKTNDIIGYKKLWEIATVRSPKRQENSFWYADLIEIKLTGSFRGGGFDGSGNPADVEYTIIANEIITCQRNVINTSCKIVSGVGSIPSQLNLVIEQDEVTNFVIGQDGMPNSDGTKYVYYHFWMYKATSSSGQDSNIGYLSLNDVNYFGNDGDMGESQIEFFNPATESKDDISELGFSVIASGIDG